MTLERYIRLIAGTFILISLALAHWVNPNWLWFTAFVGAILFQSSLTRWCLMEDILVKFGCDEEKLKSSTSLMFAARICWTAVAIRCI
jgi:hypothetical protein